MDASGANRLFTAIRSCWAPLSECGRIIPFCTPLTFGTPAIVIGTNHTEFDKDPTIASEIANRFAGSLPTENTYMMHNHLFAVRLRKCTREARIDVTDQWVGTNRCAVQSTAGIKVLKKESAFRDCQREMDELLLELIRLLQPVNVLLFGEHAHGLFYRRRSDLASRFVNEGATKVIALPHLSFRRSPSEIVDRLRAEFINKHNS